MFRHVDILNPNDVLKNKTFDTIFLLGLTKYIHLNYGDEGIIALFKNSFLLLEIGGHLIVENYQIESYYKL